MACCNSSPSPYEEAENLCNVPPPVNPCSGFGYKPPGSPKEVPFKLMFVVQWYDETAEIEKRFLMSYFDFDGTIELKDLDRQKLFLSRRRFPNLTLQDLFVGNKLYVLARHLVILDYGDGVTRNYCSPQCERAFLLVRPEALEYLPEIIQRLEKCFRILFAKMVILTRDAASEIAQSVDLVKLKNLQNQPAMAFFLMAENARQKLKNLVGEDVDPHECLLKNHQSLRAYFGKDPVMNGFYYPETEECIMKDASFFFSGCPQCTLPAACRLNGATTCCIIKPHVLRAGCTGVVLKDIVCSGFEITGIGIFWLNRRQAIEFYEIYERIYAPSDFMDMVDELSIGPCMAVELAFKNSEGNKACPVECFRQCVGPPDPKIARRHRPQTIRACHGLTKAQNAVHCTDLPEDAHSEVEYFFKILDRRAYGIKCVTGDMKSCCSY